jgi:hypothetical protein
MYIADVDKDGKKEILLGGTSCSFVLGKSAPLELQGRKVDGGELRIIQFEKNTLTLKTRVNWPGIGWARVNSVFADDIDGDGRIEIIAAGSTTKPVKDRTGTIQYITKAQALVYNWDGTRLALRANRIWVLGPFPNARINSVWAADVDKDGKKEIVVAGSAWTMGKEERAFFEVYNGGPKPFSQRKGTQVWHKSRGHTEVKAVVAKDIDTDNNIEIVTATSMRDKYWKNIGIVKGNAELIAWIAKQSDKGLIFVEKARKEWQGTNAHLTEPRSLWIGDADDEKGIEIVAGGCHYRGNLYNPDWIRANVRMWRLLGNKFNEVNKLNIIFATPSGHYWLTSCNSVYAADIDRDTLKEVLMCGEVGLKERTLLGYMGAMNPRKNFTTVPHADLYERFSTFVFNKGRDLDTYTNGIAAADLDGDKRVETIVSGYYGWYNRGVFVAVMR